MDDIQAWNPKLRYRGKQGTQSIRMNTVFPSQPETNQLNKQEITNKHSIPHICIANDIVIHSNVPTENL